MSITHGSGPDVGFDVELARPELEAERATLLAALDECTRAAANNRPDSADGIGETEHVAHAEQLELSERVAALTLEALHRVERALGRLDAGTYGICVSCGGASPSARLEALPAAEMCIGCQGRREVHAR
jgi:RNA polymerase-binding transcription factor DksA